MSVVDLDDYTELLKNKIEDVQGITECQIFSGDLTKEDLENLSLQNDQATVLLTTAGGKLSSGPGENITHCDAVFGVYIITAAAETVSGYSKTGIKLSQKIVQLIKKNEAGRNTPGVMKAPELVEWAQFGADKSSGFAAWYIIFKQLIRVA